MKAYLLDAIPLSTLTGFNTKQEQKLNKLGLYTVQDLLLHLPLRYENRTQVYRINNLLPGIWAAVEGEILYSEIIFGRRRMLVCHLSDGSGILILRFFNFNSGMKNKLILGCRVNVYGEIKIGVRGFEIVHPEYNIKDQYLRVNSQTTLTPIYPATEGIRQTTLRKLTEQALKFLKNVKIDELLPPKISCELISLRDALCTLHRPPVNDLCIKNLETGRHPAQKRLILEELIAHNLNMLKLRDGIQRHQALPITMTASCQDLSNKLLDILPFSLTNAQQRVIVEIKNDLKNNFPMMRLVQGDVGSGKTLVAALVALNVIAHNKQVALMAPTELLAEQHANNFQKWFTPLGIKIGWLTGKQKGKAREAQKKVIVSGQVNMIIGTHALFQEQVKFNNLTLVIIDEQHRFGVHQRLSFWEKGEKFGYHPHQLIMTATPIPRTLAMIAYADLDTSTIDELPPGRKPIHTVVIPHSRRKEIITRIRKACSGGRQIYWVCTLIEESKLLEVQAAEATCKELKSSLPEFTIGLLHGRMKTTEKHIIMNAFKKNEIHLLVATTVIEVGMDVPNASIMIIENSERLGLAQLHQLRGRIGRGTVPSYCILMYKAPLNHIAQKRLRVLRNTNDGFVIAQHDLEIRGPGELFGTRQTGNTAFKIADLRRDQDMVPEVQHLALHIYQYYPEKAKSLIERWLPKNQHYSNA